VVFLHNLPLVNVTVNGSAATVLLDTGAERIIMAAAAAQRFGIDAYYEYPRRMRSLDGAVASGDARVRILGVGSMTLTDSRILVGSLSLPGPSGKPLDGLLGADFFEL
jgi:predicted aspartyl protease